MRLAKISICIISLSSFLTYATPVTPGLPLSQFNFTGASVLPITQWPGKQESYYVLAREGFGNDKGTYDAFGGSKDPNETHPIATAAREFSEETIYLLGNYQKVLNHLDLKNNNTKAVIANTNKRFAIFITHYPYQQIEYFTQNFNAARNRATKFCNKEKDRIAHVKESNLRNAIANAHRDRNGRLILPVKVWATVFEPNGTSHSQEILLRPILVSSLQSYFKGNLGTLGKNKRIHFY